MTKETFDNFKDMGKSLNHKNDVPKLHEDTERSLRMIISEGRKRQETMETVEKLVNEVRDAQDEDAQHLEALANRVQALTTGFNELAKAMRAYMEKPPTINVQAASAAPVAPRKWYYKETLLGLFEPEKHYNPFDLHPLLVAAAPADVKHLVPDVENLSVTLKTLVKEKKLAQPLTNVYRLPAARDKE